MRSRVGDDLGHADLALSLVGRVLEDGFGRQAGVRVVLAHFSKHRAGVGGGFDAGDVELRQRLDMAEDRLELRLESGDLFIGQFEAGEIGDVADIDVAVRHGRERQETAGVFQVPFWKDRGLVDPR